jgi:hypothetical protein
VIKLAYKVSQGQTGVEQPASPTWGADNLVLAISIEIRDTKRLINVELRNGSIKKRWSGVTSTIRH